MTSLTRWVLAHKRTVLITWLVLAIAGVAASGPATKALDPEFSVPGKEGWETNVDISKRYRGTGGNTAPLLPVVTLPAGQSVDSPQVRGELEQLDAGSSGRSPGRASRRMGRPVTRRSSPRTGARRSRSSTAARPGFGVRREPAGREGRERGAQGRDGRRAAGPPDRLRRAVRGLGRRQRGPRPADRGRGRRRRRAGGADLRVRLVPGDPAARGRDRVDHDHVPAPARADRADERVADRAVPDRAARPGRRDRLLADRRLTLARGARARAHGRRGDPEGDGDGRPGGGVQRDHRGDRPARAGRAAAAVPALDGLRRDADPAGLDAGRDHAAAGRAGEGRVAARLAAPPHRRQGEPRLDALGHRRLAAPLGRRHLRHGRRAGPGRRGDRPAVRRLGRRHRGEVR